MQTSHSDNKTRPLPKVNTSAASAAPPAFNTPYNKERGAAIDSNAKSKHELSSGARPAYVDMPEQQQTRPEDGTYTRLSVVDHYELLAPVQNDSSARPTPPEQQKTASKQCVSVAMGCIIIGLIVVLVSSLATLFILGQKFDNNFSAKLSSLLKLQTESKIELLNTIHTLYNSCNETIDLTIRHSNTCYCLYRKPLSWNSAREFCLIKGQGVHLAEIDKKETNDFLIPILQASKTNTGIWLGGSDQIKKGVWLWNYTGKAIGTFVQSQWGPGQPSNYSASGRELENCLEVYNYTTPTFKWNDHSCENKNLKPFLCQSPNINSRCFC